jgi:hypothetical protein
MLYQVDLRPNKGNKEAALGEESQKLKFVLHLCESNHHPVREGYFLNRSVKHNFIRSALEMSLASVPMFPPSYLFCISLSI